MNWQIGFAQEVVDVPGVVISGQQIGLAVVQAVRGAILVRSLDTTKNADLARRMQHMCMDTGARYDVSPRVCGPSRPGFCWGAEFLQCTQPDLARLRALLAAGTLRLPNGHESVRKAEKFVAPALPMDPPAGLFVEVRSSILAGGDGGHLGLALAAAVHGLEPSPDPPAAPAPTPGVWRTGPR